MCRASNGDEKAVRGILDFYNAYISKVCLRPYYHANGTVNMQVDEELKGQIHTEMMKAILRFEIREK
ncbi:helix-turn-helix domain-containing protein [[Clostridium] innocuum]|nr:helix-turn-helix domain-containing protein [[Clostridium] innocuum]